MTEARGARSWRGLCGASEHRCRVGFKGPGGYQRWHAASVWWCWICEGVARGDGDSARQNPEVAKTQLGRKAAPHASRAYSESV